MSNLYQQVAKPQFKSTKPAWERWPTTYDTCPRCGQRKEKKSKQCAACWSTRPPLDPFTYIIDGELCRRIALTMWQYSTVYAKDFESLNAVKWRAQKSDDAYYAVRSERVKGGGFRHYSIHVVLMKSEGTGHLVDHANRNGLDNRRCNLRLCDSSQNTANSRKQNRKRRSSSKYKGVSWAKKLGKWAAHIRLNGHSMYIGYFFDEKDAGRAYNAKAVELFGEFARLNVID